MRTFVQNSVLRSQCSSAAATTVLCFAARCGATAEPSVKSSASTQQQQQQQQQHNGSTATAANLRLDPIQAPHPRPLRGVDLNKLSLVEEVDFGAPQSWPNPVSHPVWDLDDVEKVEVNHKPTSTVTDSLAFYSVKTCRWLFDTFSGFRFGKLTEKKVINRCLFLETVAGVPGMVGGMLRHMRSLRSMQRDYGWIHTLLEEAENERMHLLTFMEMRQPGVIFRGSVLVLQGIFFNAFFLAYLASPRFCHRFVGYLEEEAVWTYTHIIEAFDKGELPHLQKVKCSELTRNYWKLPETATIRDLMKAIRADEAGHRLVNHTFADMHERGMAYRTNPFVKYNAQPKE